MDVTNSTHIATKLHSVCECTRRYQQLRCTLHDAQPVKCSSTHVAVQSDLPCCLCLCAFCPALNVLLMAVLARRRGELRLGERGRCSFLSTFASMGVSQANSKSFCSDILVSPTLRIQKHFSSHGSRFTINTRAGRCKYMRMGVALKCREWFSVN